MNSLRNFIRAILLEGDVSDGPAGGLVRSVPLASGVVDRLTKAIPDKSTLSDGERIAVESAYNLMLLNNGPDLFDDVEKYAGSIDGRPFGKLPKLPYEGEPLRGGHEGMITGQDDVIQFAYAVEKLLRIDAQASTVKQAPVETNAGTLTPKYNYPWRTALFVITYETGFKRTPIELFDEWYNAAKSSAVKNAEQLQNEIEQDAQDRGVQREAHKRSLSLIREGWVGLGVHALLGGIYHALSRRLAKVSALRTFLTNEELWKAIWEAGSGGIRKADPLMVRGVEGPMIAKPGAEVNMWSLRKLITGFDRAELRRGVSKIETAVANWNSTFGEHALSPFEVSRVARDAINNKMASADDLLTPDEIGSALETGFVKSANDLGIPQERMSTYRMLQALANATPNTSGTTKLAGFEKEFTSDQIKIAKALFTDLKDGMSIVVSKVWSSRTAAQLLHIGNLFFLGMFVYDLYDIFYAGTDYMPIDASPDLVASVCTSSSVRMASAESLARVDDSLNKHDPNILSANQQLLMLFQTPGNTDVTTSEMNDVADLYKNYITMANAG